MVSAPRCRSCSGTAGRHDKRCPTFGEGAGAFNILAFRPRQKPSPQPRPSFGDQAKAIIAMEAAAEILKGHETTIARMAREFADAIHHLDPKSVCTGSLFISGHMLIEDVKAFQDQANQQGIPS